MLTKNSFDGHELLKFIIHGTHTNITGCTIPHWLPEDIQNRIASVICTQLRKELARFLSPPIRKPGTRGHKYSQSRDSAGVESSGPSDVSDSETDN